MMPACKIYGLMAIIGSCIFMETSNLTGTDSYVSTDLEKSCSRGIRFYDLGHRPGFSRADFECMKKGSKFSRPVHKPRRGGYDGSPCYHEQDEQIIKLKTLLREKSFLWQALRLSFYKIMTRNNLDCENLSKFLFELSQEQEGFLLENIIVIDDGEKEVLLAMVEQALILDFTEADFQSLVLDHEHELRHSL